MHDEIAVGRRDFAAVLLDDRIQRSVFGNLLVRQDGIELLGV